MAQANLERNSFVKGLITEASALTFPENASIDENNFILNRDGSRQRRLGMEYENSYAMNNTGKAPLVFDNNAITTYKWNNVNNNPATTFGVVQVGFDLWIFDLFASDVSGNVKNGGVPLKLDATTIGYVITGNTALDMTNVNGMLVITAPDMTSPISVQYDQDEDTFLVADIIMEVRDIWGVYDTLDVDERPVVLETEHNYNLLNQGWKGAEITKDFKGDTGDAALKDKFRHFYDQSTGVNRYPNVQPTGSRHGGRAQSVAWDAYKVYQRWGIDGNVVVSAKVTGYPSNADVASVGKNALGEFRKSLITGSFFGTTPAAKGKFVIDAFNRGASRGVKGILTGLGIDQEQGRPSVVTAFANRLFFSGVDSNILDGSKVSPNYTGTVFFTQTIESESQMGMCHQEADPTSDNVSDLLATDGGTIKITGASNILKLVATSTSLVVVAENGVWEITGPDGVFKATAFSISKVSNVGATSAGSVVDAEGTVLYWSNGGIYQLVPDKISGRLSAQNITETTIQTLYNNIPSVSAANVTSVFDPASRQIKWLYNDTDGYDGVVLKNKYNRELILDTVIGSFFTNTIQEIATDSPFVSGYIVTQAFNLVDDVQAVTHNGDPVQVNGVDVVVTSSVRSRGVSQTKYLSFLPNSTGSNYGLTFSHYREATFSDWKIADGVGVDAAAFLVTGYELFADSQRDKQVTYLTTHFERTESGFTDTGGGQLEATNPSSCLAQVQWDFANSSAGGKFGTQFQAYRLNRMFVPSGAEDPFDYGTSVITTKNKLRGSGKAISLKFDTSPAKDLHILGWAMSVAGKPNV